MLNAVSLLVAAIGHNDGKREMRFLYIYNKTSLSISIQTNLQSCISLFCSFSSSSEAADSVMFVLLDEAQDTSQALNVMDTISTLHKLVFTHSLFPIK